MQLLHVLTVVALALAVASSSRITRDVTKEQEDSLKKYLQEEYEKQSSQVMFKQIAADWDVATDLNNETKIETQAKVTLETAAYSKKVWMEHFKGLKPEDFKDPVLQREMTFLTILGESVLDDNELSKLNDLENNMTNIYSTAKICPFKKQNCDIEKEGLSLDPDIEGIMSKSEDYEELEYIWKAWRDATGSKMKKQYQEHVGLSNKIARLNGFRDMGEMWRRDYESEKFVQEMDDLWSEVKPLYEELRKYVLHKLAERYPGKVNANDEYIPAHLLGNMWAQTWTNIFELVKPFPNATSVDVTQALKDQGYTVQRMFKTADKFYQSLGLESNAICYNESAGAIIEKPSDREIVCHASAWDFQNGEDYRIKMCTKLNSEDFITIHHEMGHIQYYLLYRNQPITFRTGANPGFHEAVGDTIALSVATPKHLHKIGLLDNYDESNEATINALMQTALERVAFLPFGLLIDKWRWDVFSGNITENQWNEQWWHYRQSIQGVSAPVKRSENDFDPGAKYHVPGNSQYIAYFVAHILEFQLHRALCIAAGEYDPYNAKTNPLHNCDIYESKKAGDRLRAGLSLGASRHWKEALRAMTDETELSATAILDYFKPLHDWLKKENSQFVTSGVTNNSNAQPMIDDTDNDKKTGPADDQYIPIIVGSIIGALVVVAIIAYLIIRKRKNL